MDNQRLTRIMVIIVLVCAMTTAASCCLYGTDTQTLNITNISTNKDTYCGGNRVHITLRVFASDELEDVNVRLTGITNSRGVNRLLQESSLNLTKGENTLNLSYTLPRCSACLGISPGEYDIKAELSYGNNTPINKTITIRLEQ